MTTLYGITNCDTVRKARKWLDARGIDYTFHDFRADGVTQALLGQWCKEFGFEALLNKRGTTWRKLPGHVRNSIDEHKAIEVMLENPAVIKRPVLDTGKTRHVGFSSERYEEIFG